MFLLFVFQVSLFTLYHGIHRVILRFIGSGCVEHRIYDWSVDGTIDPAYCLQKLEIESEDLGTLFSWHVSHVVGGLQQMSLVGVFNITPFLELKMRFSSTFNMGCTHRKPCFESQSVQCQPVPMFVFRNCVYYTGSPTGHHLFISWVYEFHHFWWLIGFQVCLWGLEFCNNPMSPGDQLLGRIIPWLVCEWLVT